MEQLGKLEVEKLEKRARKRRGRQNVQGAILAAVAAVGIAATAPISIPLLASAIRLSEQAGYRIRYRVKTAAGRLAQKGLVRFVKKKDTMYIEITEAGRRRLAIQRARVGVSARKKSRWDKRYRLVMFDVPQHKRRSRDRLRACMKDFGFLRIQKSIWLSPYDCEELIALVKAELRLGKEVSYVIAEEIENDAWIKKHFGLS